MPKGEEKTGRKNTALIKFSRKEKREQTAIEGRKTQCVREKEREASSLRLGMNAVEKRCTAGTWNYIARHVCQTNFSQSLTLSLSLPLVIKHTRCCWCSLLPLFFSSSCLANLNKNVSKRAHRLIELSLPANLSSSFNFFAPKKRKSSKKSKKPPLGKLHTATTCNKILYYVNYLHSNNKFHPPKNVSPKNPNAKKHEKFYSTLVTL